MERWAGRVALVTGASSGIGEALAKKLVQHGMKVIGCARNVGAIQGLADSLKGERGSLTAVQCDLKQEDQILAMFDQIRTQYGGVDVCVNNAGLGHDAPLLSGATEDWRSMLDVNVLGACVCTREAFKSMKERGVDDGHIVLVNSMSGYRVLNNPSTHFYAMTKFALTAMTEGVRNELRALKSHVRITGVSPGLVDTDFTNRLLNDKDKAAARLAVHKNLASEDIADSIIYAIGTPPHVQVHDILMRPTEQAL